MLPLADGRDFLSISLSLALHALPPVAYDVGGMLEEEANVCDSTGRLVAQSHRLTSVPMPPTTPRPSGGGVAGQ